MRWFTSDQHFGHLRICELAGRPFGDVEAMNDHIVAAHNDRVAPGDTVWVLGDIVMGRLDDNLGVLSRLNGTLILVPGNHDRPWRGNQHPADRQAAWEARYLDAGIGRIVHDPAPIDIAGQAVQLSHFPYAGDSHDEDRYTGHRPHDNGGWILHGHVHDAWQVNGRQINVGVDAWGFAPVPDTVIADITAAGPSDRLVPARALAA